MNLQGVSSIVFHLARSLGGGDPHTELAAALACQATQAGHVCADLDGEAGWGPWATSMDEAQRAAFRARLSTLAAVGGADDWTPLVWDGRRLYLRRYWDYERAIADDLAARASACVPLDAARKARLAETFADAGQRQAARVALARQLCLVSGGPGTGKTHTLARIIGLLQEQEAGLRIVLAAPTGKAAARMGEALHAAGVSVQGTWGEAQTLHRLLGMRADGSGFQRNRERPLAADVLVIDEASMIDLSLMAHLLDALPATARLILLGDRDQLAAVEAGAVFADLCASPRLAHCVAVLTTNFRFGGASGIGQLADALRTGNVAGALEQLRANGRDADDLDWQAGGEARGLAAGAREAYAAYRTAVDAGAEPGELFALFSRFRVLCALRSDVVAVNRALGDALTPGLPVMVVRNDPLLRLFNGDIGLALPDPADGTLKVCFSDEGATFRWIPAVRLPAWEPAWAMTVHKSQGSEFDRVLLVLPPVGSRVATRELVYTGVTRAKRRVVLRAGEEVLRSAIASRAERMSALCERLA